MTATLQEILLAPDTQPQVTADCLTLIKQEVSAKSGVSGTAVKLAYKTVSTFASGYLQSMVETLIPDMADKLQPYWAISPAPVPRSSVTTWSSAAMRCPRPCSR